MDSNHQPAGRKFNKFGVCTFEGSEFSFSIYSITAIIITRAGDVGGLTYIRPESESRSVSLFARKCIFRCCKLAKTVSPVLVGESRRRVALSIIGILLSLFGRVLVGIEARRALISSLRVLRVAELRHSLSGATRQLSVLHIYGMIVSPRAQAASDETSLIGR